MAVTLKTTLLARRDTATNWEGSSYILKAGEFGYDTTNGIFKVGDGAKLWSALPFANQVQIEALIKAVQDDVDAINNETTGILAAAKAYADKLVSDAKLELQANIDKKVDKVEGYSLVSDDEIARLKDVDNYDDTAITGRVDIIERDYAKTADVNGALALKADKSVVDGMYTNEQIDSAIATAKGEAIAADKNTTYALSYETIENVPYIVLTPSEGESTKVDATQFIKDGMIDEVALSEDGLDLVITWNTDAGKEEMEIPLAGLVDIYTGVNGERVNVAVSSDNKISADLVAGSISKNYLDEGVQASLGKADTALQSHQDISHLATTEALNVVDGKFANYTTTADLNTALNLKADKTQVATDIATAKQEAINDAASKYEEIGVAAGLVDGLKNGDVKANADAIAAIVDETTGIYATAKNYVDGLDSAMNARVELVEADKHTHGNKDVIDGITAEKVSAWDAAEGNAKSYAEGIDGATNERINELVGYVGEFTASEGVDTVVKYIDAKTANVASDDRVDGIDTRVTTVEGKVATIEGDYLKSSDKTELTNKINGVETTLNNYVESNNTEVAAVRAIAEAARTEGEVDSQIDAKIGALNLGTTYEPIGAENRAKAYVDGKFTDANLDQYTTEQEVKDIVDGVIAAAADDETYNSLTKLIDYVDTHKGEAIDMAEDIADHETRIGTIEGKPAYGITATQISNWDNEVGAKALAETKTTTAEVKTQIEAYGYATTGYADGKADAAKDAAIADAAGKYETIGTAQGIVDALKVSETYETKTDAAQKLVDAKAYTDEKIGELNVGVSSVESGNDAITVGTDDDGKVTITHKEYSTGTITADAEEPYFLTAINVDKGHTTTASAVSLASALGQLEFILDGGSASDASN